MYHGVPFIGLPVFIDQPINVRKAEKDGYAIHLSWTTLTEQILYDAIQEMLSNPRYTSLLKSATNSAARRHRQHLLMPAHPAGLFSCPSG